MEDSEKIQANEESPIASFPNEAYGSMVNWFNRVLAHGGASQGLSHQVIECNDRMRMLINQVEKERIVALKAARSKKVAG